jgi:hypothetical protein
MPFPLGASTYMSSHSSYFAKPPHCHTTHTTKTMTWRESWVGTAGTAMTENGERV